MSYVKPRTISVTVASGGTNSTTIPLLDSLTFGFITPAALTSGSLTFEVCDTNDGTFRTLTDSAGNVPSVTIATSTAYTLTGSEADAIAPWPYVQLVMAGAEGAERTFVIVKK